MTLQQVRLKARDLGVKNVSRFRKENLIRVIQEVEGNAPCFRNISGCCESGCLWREECQL
jgi:hypothetical protein